MSRAAGVFRAHFHSPGSEKTTTGTPRERIQAGIRAYGPFYDHSEEGASDGLYMEDNRRVSESVIPEYVLSMPVAIVVAKVS